MSCRTKSLHSNTPSKILPEEKEIKLFILYLFINYYCFYYQSHALWHKIFLNNFIKIISCCSLFVVSVDEKDVNNCDRDQICVINGACPSLSIIILLYCKVIAYLICVLLLINALWYNFLIHCKVLIQNLFFWHLFFLLLIFDVIFYTS